MYSKESPCSHCAPLSLDAWKKWERQQCSKRSSSSTKGPKVDSAKGGNKSGKVCPEVPSTSKAESPGRLRLAALESGFSSFKSPCSRVSRELEDPLASQWPFTCDLSEPSRVMGPSGSTSHTATAMDPVHGSQWSSSSTDITLTAKQGAALTSSYGSNGMGEVSTGTASTAFTGQRSQPTDAPWGPVSFQGRGKRQPLGRHRPSTLVELGHCPTGQRYHN